LNLQGLFHSKKPFEQAETGTTTYDDGIPAMMLVGTETTVEVTTETTNSVGTDLGTDVD